MRNTVIGIIILVFALLGFYYGTKESAPENLPSSQNENDTLPPQAGLPPQVKAKRQAIYAAAMAKDYDRLGALVSSEFSYSFGAPLESFAEYLKLSEKDESKSVFEIIPVILKMDYTKRGDIYAWPSVFGKTAAEWTEEDVAEMRKILTDEQIESYREFGSYAYYRLGIRENGDWIYYIAGD